MRAHLAPMAMLLAATAIVTLAGCGGKEKTKAPEKPAMTVTAHPVQVVSLPRTVDASGTVSAWNEVPVGSETGGLEAKAVLVDEGAWVRQGQVLVQLDDRLLRAQLRQQEAQVASARAQLANAQSALGRAQELKAQGFVAQATLDSRQAEQRVAEANVRAAEAGVAETQARLEQTRVRAPVSGRIAARSVVKGQIVAAGTELFRLVREGRLELNAQVPESDLRLLRPGLSAEIAGDQTGVETGVVRLVTPEVDPRTRLGLARITLAAGTRLRPGNFARASIDLGAQPSLAAPQSAIIYREGHPGLYVIDARSRVHFRPVTTGLHAGEAVAVTGAIRAGDRVVVDGAGFLGDNDLVKVVTGPSAGR